MSPPRTRPRAREVPSAALFSPESVRFLAALRRHNDRVWFAAHRDRYEAHLLAPFRALATGLADTMLGLDPELDVAPAVGHALSRIHRDTRFSHDQRPFRESMWLVFKRPRRDYWSQGVGWFFELYADRYRFGMGFGEAMPRLMAAFRRTVDRDPRRFARVVAFRRRHGNLFDLEGPKYLRPHGPARPPAIADWYERRSFYLACNRRVDRALFSARLADEVAGRFLTLAPLYHYLLEVVAAAGTDGHTTFTRRNG